MNIRIDGFITYTKYVWDDKPTYSFCSVDPSKYDAASVAVMEHSFYVEVPDNFDPRPGQIAALKAQKEEVAAEFSKKVMEIDARINELLALEA